MFVKEKDMTKKQSFIEELKGVLENYQWKNEEAKIYWETLSSNEEIKKETFTDNGKMILGFLQQNQETILWKSRDIAEKLFVGSRTVAGSLRKLVSDGYVEKIGENPVIYSITEKGKNIDLTKENE